MRILQINSVYKVGSTGKIVDCVANVLRDQGNEVFTCYGIGNLYYDEYSLKICTAIEHKFNALLSRVRGIPYGGLYYSNIKFERLIEKYRPDIVHLHCVNANTINVYALLKYLARNKVKTVITLHAEFFYTAGCEHSFECEKFKLHCDNCQIYKSKIGSYFLERSRKAWSLMWEAFSYFYPENIMITAVSPWLVARAASSTILKRLRIQYVPNGIDTGIFYHRTSKILFKNANFKKRIIFVTPYFCNDSEDLKGGHLISHISSYFPDYEFIIVASRVANHLITMPPNVCVWGRAKSQDELAQLYSESDVTILLSKRETFSMVTVESLCCGTPVVGFDSGGPETIALDNFSVFVPYGKVDLLVDAIKKMLNTNINRKQLSLIAKTRYSQENMTNLYSLVYKDLIR